MLTSAGGSSRRLPTSGSAASRRATPSLLDWLATRFVAGGWSIKAIQREIVLSRTYQLSSDFDPARRRGRSRESLAVAVSRAAGSMPSRFATPCWRSPAISTAPAPAHTRSRRSRRGTGPSTTRFNAVYPSNHRAVYLMTQRLVKHPYLALFDGPDTNSSTDSRPHSTVPLQALYLMNNPFVLEQAAAFARRLVAGSARFRGADRAGVPGSPGADRPSRLSSIARSTLCAIIRLLQRRPASPAASCERDAWTSFAKVMLTANEFLYLD